MPELIVLALSMLFAFALGSYTAMCTIRGEPILPAKPVKEEPLRVRRVSRDEELDNEWEL